MMSSIEETDKESAAVAVAPRVTLDDIKSSIIAQFHFTAELGNHCYTLIPEVGSADDMTVKQQLKLLNICVVIVRNGFSVVGKSAPASPENYNREFGEKLAYEDCIRQLWPLMGFALREKLSHG
jgi:hypothetical protein